MFNQYRHRSRVILDLFHDFQSVSFSDYVINVSDILHNQLHLIPESAKHYFMAMQKYGWLEGYGSIDGIRLVLNQMSKRKYMNSMESSAEVLVKHYQFFKA